MRSMSPKPLSFSLALSAASLLWAVAGPASSQPQSGAAGAARYDTQRQGCGQGNTWEDRKTCLRESAAARQAARQGVLYKGPQDYSKNAISRCSALPQADREECVARIERPTETSGSVASGGVLYEHRELVPAGTPGSQVIPGSKVVPIEVVVPAPAPAAGAVIVPGEAVIVPRNAVPAR